MYVEAQWTEELGEFRAQGLGFESKLSAAMGLGFRGLGFRVYVVSSDTN